jgi:hypothetical protein
MRAFAVVLAVSVLGACSNSDPVRVPGQCAPGAPAIELTGSVTPGEAKTYRILPFAVGAGTGRVELSYRWFEHDGPPPSPVTATVLDLGLWDPGGYRNQAAFRGWGGSRQGRIDEGDPPIFVQADAADRGFTPGAIVPGTWYAELGIPVVSPQGADYVVRVECKAASGTPPAPDRVAAGHVAHAATRWYHGDFHMHAYHSNPAGPEWPDFVAAARLAKLDFLMVTEYVTGRHWTRSARCSARIRTC